MAKKQQIKDREGMIPRTVYLDIDFHSEVNKENKIMNDLRRRNLKQRLSGAEEIIELAKEGLVCRKEARKNEEATEIMDVEK